MATLGKKYTDKQVICRQGEVEECMYSVQSGSVEIVREEDGAAIVLGELGPGEIFGEMALFGHQRHYARVQAKGDARVLTLDKQAFLKRAHEDPSFAFRLLERLARRTQDLLEEISQQRRWDAGPNAPTLAKLTMHTMIQDVRSQMEVERAKREAAAAPARRTSYLRYGLAGLAVLLLVAGWLIMR